MDTSPSRTCRLELTCDLAAPRTSRRLVTVLLGQWGVVDHDALNSAAIVVSELVTNALVHGGDGGTIVLTVELREQVLRLRVEDRIPVIPTQRYAGPHDENGRGLDIVAQLAAHWDVEPLPDGKRIVVDLPYATAG